ncbi:MAG: hypothetical protein ACRD0Z_05200 [Acidimicrobiales bacterium]
MKVVCVTGHGRSGSTLLDRILGQLPGFTSLGEVRDLFDDRGVAAHRCSCGSTVLDCDFWSVVLKDALASSGIDEQQATSLRAAEERQRHIPRLWWELRRRPGRPLNPYGELLVNLYQAATAYCGTTGVIDSSKFVSDILILCRDPRVDLYVIHLVRDPRAAAFSWSRPTADPGRQGESLQTFSPAMSSFWWAAANGEAELFVRRRLGSRYQRLRYEDFVTAPRQVLGAAAEAFGCRAEDLPLEGSGAVHVGSSCHLVGGNPNRFQSGTVELALDERWRQAMSGRDLGKATLPAVPLLHRYGYPLLPSRTSTDGLAALSRVDRKGGSKALGWRPRASVGEDLTKGRPGS